MSIWKLLWKLLWNVVASVALLVLAAVQAFQGDWFPAIFLAVLWVGWTNNISHSINTTLLILIAKQNNVGFAMKDLPKGQWN